MDEGKIAGGGFVVSSCEASSILELVNAALDPVAEGVDEVVDGDLEFAAAAHGNDGMTPALADVGAHAIGVVAFVADKHFRIGRFGVHHEVVALVVRDFAAGDFCREREPFSVGPEVDFRGEAALRAAETLFLSPPFAPAA